MEQRKLYRIYKLYSPDTDLVYIGITTLTIEERLQGHKHQYNYWLKYKDTDKKTHYCSSYKLLEITDNILYECLEETYDNSRELFHIKQHKEFCSNQNIGQTENKNEYNRIREKTGKRKEYYRIRDQTEKRKEYNRIRNREKYRRKKQMDELCNLFENWRL